MTFSNLWKTFGNWIPRQFKLTLCYKQINNLNFMLSYSIVVSSHFLCYKVPILPFLTLKHLYGPFAVCQCCIFVIALSQRRKTSKWIFVVNNDNLEEEHRIWGRGIIVDNRKVETKTWGRCWQALLGVLMSKHLT